MLFEPFTSTPTSDPASVWRRILDRGDHVTYDVELETWLIAGHDLVRAVLTDSRHFTTCQPIHPQAATTAEQTTASQHARSRAALAAVFPTTSTRVEHQWSALIRRRAVEYADQLAHQVAATPWPDVDLMDLFSSPFALAVLLDILGIPADDSSHVATRAAARAALHIGDHQQTTTSGRLLVLGDYCRDLDNQRAGIHRDAQPAGLITDLLDYRADDDHRLTLPDVTALAVSVILEGWETPTNALCRALDHGLRQPARWARLGFDDHYASVHAEESLRHSPAVHAIVRITTTDVDIEGTIIPAGSRCLILIGAANHDERVFPQPTAFQPHRAKLGQHLSFGAGTHYCTGAALARLSITIALQTLARRLPELCLAPGIPSSQRPSLTTCRHTALPATLSPAGCPAIAEAAMTAVLP